MNYRIRNACATALGILIALCAALMILINFTPEIGFADEAEAQVIAAEAAKGKYADEVYLSAASVCLNEMQIRANGGGEVNNAFDKNTSSVWRSALVNGQGFTNSITLSFDSAVTVDCIIYVGAFEEEEGKNVYYGFPELLKVHSVDGPVATFKGEPESAFTQFKFEKPITGKTLTLEFTELDGVAAANEIYIVKSLDNASEKVTEEVNKVFTDYARLKLDKGLDEEKLANLRTRAEGCANYAALKPVLDRAEEVLAGLIKKDTVREFSTDKSAANKVNLYGGAKKYSRDTLLTSSFGTDRQALGVGGTYGEKFTVYLEADEGLPLPSLAFTYENGEGLEEFAIRPLARGVNTVNYPQPATEKPHTSGGAVYLISPEAKKDVSGNFKIYVEGGYTYPVLREGGNEKTFIRLLKDYTSRLADPNDLSVTVDICELAASNVIITGAATYILDYYTHGDISPQQNISDWNKYVRSILSFCGITFDKKDEAYDSRNEALAVNFRFTATYCGANIFESDEFIGVADENYRNQLLDFDTPDRAITLSLARSLEKQGRIWQGFTDEFPVIYANWLLDGEYALDIAGVSKNLASDFGEYAINKNLWLNGGDAAWWALVGFAPDYWAKLERLYCFEQTGKTLDPTEKFIYYSSLALGSDMGAYFERWGYYHGDSVYNANNRFSCAKASAEYKELISGIGNSKKFHYIDDKQFTYLFEHGGKLESDWAAAYGSGQTATVKEIVRTADGYTLFMPDPAKPDAHLCYEVQGYVEGEWKVLGVTYGTAFCDNYRYAPGERPRYRVYAYDRLLNCTGTPREVSPDGSTVQSEVCRVGNVRYNSLREAVAAASTGEKIIYLLKSFSDSGVVIDKSLTILADPSIPTTEVVTITACGAGPLITVNAALTMGGAGARIILDGKGVYRTGALVEISSLPSSVKCTFTNVTFKNSYNFGNGGGLYLGYGAQEVNLYNCVIENNRAENGGGAYLAGDSYNAGNVTRLNLYGVTISGNTAKHNGGGIYSRASVTLKGATITGNAASKQGGGAYVADGNIGRRFELTDCTVADNIAGELTCTAVYFAGGYSTLNGGKIKGGIFKQDSAMLNINGSMPDFTEAEFYLDEIAEEGSVLINTITGFTATEDKISALKVANGNPTLSGAGVTVIPKVAKITVNFEGGSLTVNTDCGKFTLPERTEGLKEGYYISKWSTEEKDYFPGDVVEIVFDCEFKVELTRYFKVTLVYGVKTQKAEVIQFGEFSLPGQTPEGDAVYGWYCSDGQYYSCGEIKDIEYDTVFTADLKNMYAVTLSVCGVETTSYYGYGTSIVLYAPAAVNGKSFSYWQADGKTYAAGEAVVITKALSAAAVYSQDPDNEEVTDVHVSVIDFVNGEELITEYSCAYGGAVYLPLPSGGQDGKAFSHWAVNGERREVGETVTVTENTVIVAVYDRAFTVKLTQLVGGEQKKDEYVLGYTRKFTLPAPAEVPEGKIFLHWAIGSLNFDAGDVITVMVDVEIKAQYEDLANYSVTLATSDNEEDNKSVTVVKGEVFTLPEPDNKLWGDKFHYWDVNGVRYAAGACLTVLEDTVIKAVYSAQYKVTVIQFVDGVERETAYTVSHGDSFKLPTAAPAPDDRTFSCWEIGGKQYAAGARITVTEDTVIKAVYHNKDGEEIKPSGNRKKWIIIGSVAGGAAVIAVGAWVTVRLIKKRKADADKK